MLSKRKLEPPESPWYESNLIWGPVAFILSAIPSINHDLRWFLWLAWPCFGLVIWRLSKKTREPRLVAMLGIAITGGGLLWLGSLLRPKAVSVKADIATSAPPLNRAGTSTPAALPPTKNQQTESGITAGTTAKSHRPAAGGALAHSSPSSMPTKKPQLRGLSEVALTLAGNIRKLSQDWETEQSKISNASDVTDQQRKSMSQYLAVKVMAEYDSKYKVDARIVHDKLVEALPPGTEGLAMNDDYENEVNPGLLEIIASDLEHLAKLLPAGDDDSSPEPRTSISAPNGIAIGGGNVTNPTVNNYEPAPPKIRVDIEYPTEAEVNSSPPRRGAAAGSDKPSVSVLVTLQGNFERPAFAFTCDIPCRLVDQGLLDTSAGSVSNVGYPVRILGSKHDPTSFVVLYYSTSQMLAGTRLQFSLRSLDGSPFRISNVTTWVPPAP